MGVMATSCPLRSRRASPVVWIVRDFLSHVLILLPVRAQPMQSPTTLLRTRTASPSCGLLQAPCQGRSSSWQQWWVRNKTGRRIGRISDPTLLVFDELAYLDSRYLS